MIRLAIELMERGLLPDAVVRAGIRRLCRARLAELARTAAGDPARAEAAFAAAMRDACVAPVPEKANEQHYEVPAEFYRHCLGAHRKYSSAWWPEGVETLDEAERRAIDETIARADLRDGMDVLELGCGWGSLTLRMAERFPASRILAVSNSASQRAHIEGEAARRGLRNVRVITRDMNAFDPGPDAPFDRIVSVEMFEHMRNWDELLRRCASWLRPQGRVFLHVFCHRTTPYAFATEGDDDWMGRHFFTGGIMPSERLVDRFDAHLRTEERWSWDGTHYQRTAEAWLANLDARRDAVLPILAATYGAGQARRWFRRWRIFFMACAELFGFDGGREWLVAHARLAPVPVSPDGSDRSDDAARRPAPDAKAGPAAISRRPAPSGAVR